MSRTNNKLTLRGRFVRDPIVSPAKDGSGRQFVFGRIAVDQPYVDSRGDTKTSTSYFEVKVFDGAAADVLIAGGARQGTLVELSGSARLDRSEFEKDGEPQVAHSIAVVLDDPALHQAVIEAQPRDAQASEARATA